MTTYYIDYNRGDDASADPTNINTPWKHLTKIKTISAAAGDQFLLADDSEWDYTMADVAVTAINWTGTKDNPVIIGKYSPSGTPSSAKPTIRWGNDIAANEWTYSAPNNAWSYTPGGGINVNKLGLVLLNGEWGARKQESDAFPLPSVDGVFNVVTTTFWIYAPAGTDPTTYYGGVRLSSKQNGGFFSFGYNARAVTVRDILFKDSGSCIHMFCGPSGPDQFIVVDSCDGLKVSSMVQCVPSGNDHANLVVKNCNVVGWGANVVWVFDNNFLVSSFEIYGNTITDGNRTFSQGGFYVQAQCRSASIIHNNNVSYAQYGGVGQPLDGCGIYVDIGSINVVVRDNEISYCYIAMTDGSDYNTVYRNNYVHHCKLGLVLATTGAATDWQILVENNTFICGYNIIPAAGSKPGTGIYHYHTATDVLTSEYIRNNAFVNVGESNDTTGAAILLRDTYTPTTLDMSNNSYYGYTYEVMSYPSLTPEATPPNTVTADPELDSNGHPQDGSPLIQAGIHTGYKVDACRSQRWNPPTIGAYEYTPARTARL